MGKRKSRKKPSGRRVNAIQALPTLFDCPFCNHKETCEVKIDKEKKTGTISCWRCEESFKTQIHQLSEPLDVFNDWIDACERVN